MASNPGSVWANRPAQDPRHGARIEIANFKPAHVREQPGGRGRAILKNFPLHGAAVFIKKGDGQFFGRSKGGGAKPICILLAAWAPLHICVHRCAHIYVPSGPWCCPSCATCCAAPYWPCYKFTLTLCVLGCALAGGVARYSTRRGAPCRPAGARRAPPTVFTAPLGGIRHDAPPNRQAHAAPAPRGVAKSTRSQRGVLGSLPYVLSRRRLLAALLRAPALRDTCAWTKSAGGSRPSR